MRVLNKIGLSSIMLVAAGIVSVIISIKVGANSPFWLDSKVADWFSGVPDSVIPFFVQITEMGDKKGIGAVGVLVLLWLLFKKKNYLGAGVFALAVALGNEVSNLLKDAFARPRPEIEHLIHVTSYSYPSGHAMVGMIVYFLIAYLVMESVQSKIGKSITIVIIASLLLLIGASRIILQVHYPSDVLGGYALGFLWVSIWIGIYRSVRQRQTRKKRLI
ncbi:phosphatase PAP2 family protein [Neobacillus muris]|uniref:phosphatase PAP2 family protein n=1 Tax=Neobacillus muris TaxID=2941334 RepID=UPI00203B09CC|nr:phosphatase PAP2 family protein [Neobacillus muris]